MKKFRMKKMALTLIIISSLVFSLSFSGAAEVGVKEDEILIGSFVALSGPVAAIGTPLANGMRAYFTELNANGGINGRKIRIIIEDDGFVPSKTVSAVRKMVEKDKVFAIVGGLGSNNCLAVMDYLVKKKVPFVYPASGATKLGFPAKENIFVVQPNYRTEGKVIAKFIYDKFTDKKIAFIHDDSEIGKEGAKYTAANLAVYNIEAVADVTFPTNNVDFSSYVLKLKEAGAEFVVYHGTVAAAASIRKEAVNIGYDFDMIVNYALADPVMFALAGDAWEGVYSTAWLPPLAPDAPGVSNFYETYSKHYPEAGGFAYAAAGWVAAEVFTEAIRRCGDEVTYDNLIQALESMDNWNGDLARNVGYAPNKRSGVTDMMILQAKDGGYVEASDWYDGSY